MWIGSRTGPEGRLVAEAGIPFFAVPAGKLRRYLSLRNVADIFRIMAGVAVSLRVLARERPALLFSKGGFVSVPPVVAARLLRIPAFTHESDVDPGLATRINSRFCEQVLVSHPETAAYFPEGRRASVVVTGNPVRPCMRRGSREEGRRLAGCQGTELLVLVLGGSLGSAALNALVSRIASDLVGAGVRVVHQVGEQGAAAAASRPAIPGYLACAFLGPELPHLMAGADLVVSRAGANTLAELAALGRPSVLVPLPTGASRGDQLRNAELFRSRGAAVVLPEEGASPERLRTVVRELLEDAPRLAAMSQAARALAHGDPAAGIAEMIARRIAGAGARR